MLGRPIAEARAAYVHVPFCHHRCPYCNFTVAVSRPEWVARYLTAIELELQSLGRPRSVASLFIGGGTPSSLDLPDLAKLLRLLGQWLPLASGGEWTLEANPQDLTEEKAALLAEAGVNRVSLGGQSFQSEKLQRLGRSHRAAELRQAIACGHRYFPQLSLDLIFGVPGETLAMWSDDLRQAVAAGVQHLSTYGLTYERGAAFWGLRQRGELVPCSEELELQLYWQAIDGLAEHGFEHYEVSNFALAGHACRHNRVYWHCEPWWAFGPGAASYLDGQRRVNHRSTLKYLQRMEAGLSPVAEAEAIDRRQWTLERFVFGMRLMAGVDWTELQRIGEPHSLAKIEEVVPQHVAAGWLAWRGNRLHLTRHGLAISDSLWPAYLASSDEDRL
jgi:oxygen-independent coproporphyrinogen-3 oxidase